MDQREHPPCGKNLSYSPGQYKRFHQTSGSTGRPLIWLDTEEDWNHCIDARISIFQACGIRASDRMMFAFRFGPFTGSYGSFEAGIKLGAFCVMGGSLKDEDRLAMVADHGLNVLVTTPSCAMRMGILNSERSKSDQPCKLDKILIIGEPGGSVRETRSRLKEIWGGATIYDYYGVTETGAVGYQCPANETFMHLLSDHVFAEVIDPISGRQTRDGEKGELVLTTLKRMGRPVVRYRTCDLVIAKDLSMMQTEVPCFCGSKNPTILGGILGRVDQIAIMDGINLYPAVIDGIVSKCSSIRDYRVFVEQRGGLMQVSLGILPAPLGTVDEKDAIQELTRCLKESLPTLSIPVRKLHESEIGDQEGKIKRWVWLRS